MIANNLCNVLSHRKVNTRDINAALIGRTINDVKCCWHFCKGVGEEEFFDLIKGVSFFGCGVFSPLVWCVHTLTHPTLL